MRMFSGNTLLSVIATALTACGSGPVAPAAKSAAPITSYVTCDYFVHGCAQVGAGDLGDVLVLRPKSPQALQIREIKDESEFATEQPVVFDTVGSECGNRLYFKTGDSMTIDWHSFRGEYEMSIVRTDPTSHEETLIFDTVILKPQRKLDQKKPETVKGHVYWLVGTSQADESNNSVPVVFYIYLVNLQETPNTPMNKRYLVEVFDSECMQDVPIYEDNLGYPKIPAGGSPILEPTSGNGWEPHR